MRGRPVFLATFAQNEPSATEFPTFNVFTEANLRQARAAEGALRARHGSQRTTSPTAPAITIT